MLYTREKRNGPHKNNLPSRSLQSKTATQLQNNMKTARAWLDVKLYRNRNEKTFELRLTK